MENGVGLNMIVMPTLVWLDTLLRMLGSKRSLRGMLGVSCQWGHLLRSLSIGSNAMGQVLKAIPAVIWRMMDTLYKQGYHFVVVVVAPSADGVQPAILTAGKGDNWHGMEFQADAFSPARARVLLRLMLEQSPRSAGQMMAYVDEFVDRYHDNGIYFISMTKGGKEYGNLCEVR
jgi:hypothetical protein